MTYISQTIYHLGGFVSQSGQFLGDLLGVVDLFFPIPCHVLKGIVVLLEFGQDLLANISQLLQRKELVNHGAVVLGHIQDALYDIFPEARRLLDELIHHIHPGFCRHW